MAKLEQYSRKIANYIFEDMEPEERVQFEAELESNEELAKEYRRQINAAKYLKTKAQVEEVVNDPDFAEAERQVEQFFREKDAANDAGAADTTKASDAADAAGAADSSNERPATRPSANRSLKRILYPLLAAAAIFTGIILVLQAPGDPNERIFNRYYQPLADGRLISRGQTSGLSVTFEEALNLYFEEDYSQSASLFSELSQSDPNQPEYSLFEGLSVLGAGEYSKAATVFDSYLSRYDIYIPEAQWYLSLCYVKLEQPEKAKDLLNELSSLDGKYGVDSKKLLKKLK